MRWLGLVLCLALVAPATADGPSDVRATYVTPPRNVPGSGPHPSVRVLSRVSTPDRVFVLMTEDSRIFVLDSESPEPIFIAARHIPGGPACADQAALPCITRPEIEPAADGGLYLHGTMSADTAHPGRILRWKVDEGRALPPIDLPPRVAAAAVRRRGATVAVRPDGGLWFVGVGGFARFRDEATGEWQPVVRTQGKGRFEGAHAACFQGRGTLVAWSGKASALAAADADSGRVVTPCDPYKGSTRITWRSDGPNASSASMDARFYLWRITLKDQDGQVRWLLKDSDPRGRRPTGVKERAPQHQGVAIAAFSVWTQDAPCTCASASCEQGSAVLNCGPAIVYRGAVRDGRPDGTGEAEVAGVRFGGIFEDGILTRGYRRDADGTVFVGTFSYGVPDRGRVATPAGAFSEVRSGEWVPPG